jgi:hypothetical protein
MNQVPIPYVGVPLHCPDCHRQLISFNENGTINMAGLTSVTSMAEEYYDEDGEVQQPKDAVVLEATCLRRPCRIKRFIRDHQRRK